MEEKQNKSNLIDQPAIPVTEGLNDLCRPIGISTGPVIIIPSMNQPFVEGSVQTAVGAIPQISSRLTGKDRWGTIKCRLGAGRLHYAVDPGLYALGNPVSSSPVLVSANYKMSFDVLRRSLAGRPAWILVLDTKGINVWCAAGKGTFGTSELIHRIDVSGLKRIVTHRQIIVPQLGAPGVAAHIVKQFSGFKVHYGPVQAADLSAYLDNGLKATKEMRTVPFLFKDRALLVPVELAETIRPLLILSFVALLLSTLLGPADALNNFIHEGLFAFSAIILAVIAGAVLHPILLPWLPGRAFSIKGLTIGVIVAVGLIYARGMNWSLWTAWIEAVAWILIVASISAYLAMNFTGCSTYTSLSGVKKEMRIALPVQIVAAGLGSAFWIGTLICK